MWGVKNTGKDDFESVNIFIFKYIILYLLLNVSDTLQQQWLQANQILQIMTRRSKSPIVLREAINGALVVI